MRFVAATAKIRAKLGGDSPEMGRKEGKFEVQDFHGPTDLITAEV